MNLDLFTVAPGEKPLDNLKAACGFAGIFKEIGIIGDSLSSGEFESQDEEGNTFYHDMYEYSWPAVLERLTGTVYRNYSRGGMTAKEYLESWADQNGFWQWNQAYIIALGNNDIFGANQPAGSAADIHPEDPAANPDTFLGDMGRIVQAQSHGKGCPDLPGLHAEAGGGAGGCDYLRHRRRDEKDVRAVLLYLPDRHGP